jgi:hypothetical protein
VNGNQVRNRELLSGKRTDPKKLADHHVSCGPN